MPYFCIYDHPELVLVQARISESRIDSDPYGYRLRYLLEIPPAQKTHGREVIAALDDRLRAHVLSPGTYQLPYATVRREWGELLPSASPSKAGRYLLRATRLFAILLAAVLGITAIVGRLYFTMLTLTLAALRRRSGAYVFFQLLAVEALFDWARLIDRLLEFGDIRVRD